MSYIQGFVVAVPTANREAYRRQAADSTALFHEFGATRMVEAWGDDVPDGTINDFRGAVQAKPDETVVFSWIEYPDRATYDAAIARMNDDPRMAELGANMPFDGSRMIFAGFEPVLEEGRGGTMGYVDGFVAPVPVGNREAYRQTAARYAPLFLKHGATRVIEAWGDDVPDGKVTDYKRAAHAEADENVVFSWIEWPSKEARTKGWETFMQDAQAKPPEESPFDGKRMIYGGFEPIVDA